jgi:hypothetical protein
MLSSQLQIWANSGKSQVSSSLPIIMTWQPFFTMCAFTSGRFANIKLMISQAFNKASSLTFPEEVTYRPSVSMYF